MNLPWTRRSTLGRELDHRYAVVTGEGAAQRISHPEQRKGTYPVPLWQQVPSLPGEPQRDYYRLPLLKEPVWIWSVPVYFYVGGVAGGSALLAALLHGKKRVRNLAAACRWLAFIGTTVGPALLTWDLGRKFRFINMLRTFRPTSPMSMGSWALAGTGALSALALLQGDRPSARPTAMAVAGGGVVLSGYTGVLLAGTANPLWKNAHRTLPLLFTASSIASTAGVLEMLPLNAREESVVQRFGTIGKIAEAAGMVAMERETAKNREAARALETGRAGFLWKSAKGLLAAGIAVSLIPVHAPWKRRLGGALTTAGALCLRFALLESGKHAAREPQAVIHDGAAPRELQRNVSAVDDRASVWMKHLARHV